MALEVVAAVPQEADREDGADHGHRDHRGVGRAPVGAAAAVAAAASQLLVTKRAELPPLDGLGRAALRPGEAWRLLEELVEPGDVAVALERVPAEVEVRH